MIRRLLSARASVAKRVCIAIVCALVMLSFIAFNSAGAELRQERLPRRSAQESLAATNSFANDPEEESGFLRATGFMTNLYDVSLGLTTVLLLVALGWSVSLRRRVREQIETIRDQIQREAALEEKYRELFENANDMVFSLDLNGRFVALNKAGEKILGCSREAALRAHLREFAAAGGAGPCSEWIENCLQGKTSSCLELQIVGRAGGASVVEVSALPRKNNGLVEGLECIARDITEKKRAEEALRQSEERFSSAFRVSPVAIAISSMHDGRFIDVNKSFLQLFQFERREVLGASMTELGIWISPENRASIEKRLHETGSVCGAECLFRTKKKEMKTALLFAECIDLGPVRSVLTIVHDMTERLLLEDKLRKALKMEAVGRLAAGVAHDFNNLLTIIQGNTEIAMLRNSENRAMGKSLERISQASQRAANLTRQLLTFSRSQKLQPKPLDLNEVISNAIKMFKHLLRDDIDLRFRFAPSLPVVEADPTMIEQVIMNLVVNARDAMVKGGELTVATEHHCIDEAFALKHPEASVGHHVCMSVIDTGCGMDEATQSRIFEPFFTTKDVGKGTGLGLATVYGIVKQHKGWIEVDSQVGHGTVFSVFIPSREPHPSAATQHLRSALDDGRPTILVVESEAAVRELVSEVLHDKGFRVLEASDGLQGLQVWNDHQGPIDLLLTDTQMPHGMSGIELAENLTALKPDLKVILSSGSNLDARGLQLKSGRRTLFLAKPYSTSELLRVAETALASSQTAAAKVVAMPSAVA